MKWIDTTITKLWKKNSVEYSIKSIVYSTASGLCGQEILLVSGPWAYVCAPCSQCPVIKSQGFTGFCGLWCFLKPVNQQITTRHLALANLFHILSFYIFCIYCPFLFPAHFCFWFVKHTNVIVCVFWSVDILEVSVKLIEESILHFRACLYRGINYRLSGRGRRGYFVVWKGSCYVLPKYCRLCNLLMMFIYIEFGIWLRLI